MKAQVITTDHADLFPVRPWQHAVAASQGSAGEADAVLSMVEPAAIAAPRKARDRGASAVEWVIITGIVVAIVAGVGYGISKAISGKADQACNQINGAGNVSVTGGGNAGTGAPSAASGGCGK